MTITDEEKQDLAYLSTEQINKQYAGKWVVIVNIRESDFYDMLGGEIYYASPYKKSASKAMGRAIKEGRKGIFVTYCSDIKSDNQVLIL
jgi:hypothetical protein